MVNAICHRLYMWIPFLLPVHEDLSTRHNGNASCHCEKAGSHRAGGVANSQCALSHYLEDNSDLHSLSILDFIC